MTFVILKIKTDWVHNQVLLQVCFLQIYRQISEEDVKTKSEIENAERVKHVRI